MRLIPLSVCRVAIRWFGRFHVFGYEKTRGWWGSELRGLPILLLYGVGRKTGLPRTTALVSARSRSMVAALAEKSLSRIPPSRRR